MIRRRPLVAGLFAIAALQPTITAGTGAQSVAKISLDEITSQGDRDASPVFLSDDSVGLLIRSGGSRAGVSKVVILRWADGKLKPMASATKTNEGEQIYAASGGRLIIAGVHHKYLYAPDLSDKWEIPIRVLPSLFPRSGVLGEASSTGWKVFRLAPELVLVNAGVGELLSTSDDTVVFRLDNVIHTEAHDGRALGTIPTQADTKGTRVAEIAGPNRLFLHFSSEGQIVDFNGNELARIPRPDGWGFRHGWSAGGTRVLFDHYTRTEPASGRAFDRLANLLSSALGAPQEANGEMIRVIETSKGGICFSLDSPGRLLGPAGQYHADIAPSGRLVVVASQAELTIYSLPETCPAK